MPFGQDGSYSHEAIVGRINADLANGIGNLAQRSLSMVAKNCGGRVPDWGDLAPADRELLAEADALADRARAAMEHHALHEYLAAAWRVIGAADRYFAGEEPWVKRKTDPARMGTVLAVVAEVVRELAILLQPVMPGSMAQLPRLSRRAGRGARLRPSRAGPPAAAGTALPAPSGVFPRYVEPEAAA